MAQRTSDRHGDIERDRAVASMSFHIGVQIAGKAHIDVAVAGANRPAIRHLRTAADLSLNIAVARL